MADHRSGIATMKGYPLLALSVADITADDIPLSLMPIGDMV